MVFVLVCLVGKTLCRIFNQSKHSGPKGPCLAESPGALLYIITAWSTQLVASLSPRHCAGIIVQFIHPFFGYLQ